MSHQCLLELSDLLWIVQGRIFLQTGRDKLAGTHGAHIVQIGIRRSYDVLVVRVE